MFVPPMDRRRRNRLKTRGWKETGRTAGTQALPLSRTREA